MLTNVISINFHFISLSFPQQWMNSDLTWDEADYNGTSVVHVGPKKIWAPDIILYNR